VERTWFAGHRSGFLASPILSLCAQSQVTGLEHWNPRWVGRSPNEVKGVAGNRPAPERGQELVMDQIIVAVLVISFLGLVGAFVVFRRAVAGREFEDSLRGQASLEPVVSLSRRTGLPPARRAA